MDNEELGFNPHDLLFVYTIHPENRRIRRQLAGKIALFDEGAYVLSDYFGLLANFPEGEYTARTVSSLRSLQNSMYTNIETLGQKGERERQQKETEERGEYQAKAPDPIPSIELSRKRPPIFKYHRAGMDKAHTLELIDGVMLLDGNKLDGDEISQVLSNIHTGVATLKRSEEGFQDLQKGMLGDAWKSGKTLLGRIPQAARAAGHAMKGGTPGDYNIGRAIDEAAGMGMWSPELTDRTRRAVYEDEMVPGLGNKRAYMEYVQEHGERPGYKHVMLDANDFKQINDVLGHEAGDAAIQQLGQAILRAKGKVYKGHEGDIPAKSHRFGGDEFSVHLPEEHAPLFLRHLRQELESVPPLAGRFNLSMSAGMGYTPGEADAALNQGAKAQKKAAVQSLGRDPDDRTSLIRAPDALYAHSAKQGPLTTAEGQKLPDLDWGSVQAGVQDAISKFGKPPPTS
jgi:diguanylate cyclase (GGDEF)-like protein